jgi:hypothetical protein
MGNTISRGAVIKVSTSEIKMMYLRNEHGEKSCSEDLKQ